MKTGRKRLGILTAAILISMIFAGKIVKVLGEDKEEEEEATITFGEFSKKIDIEDSVLYIGTHLIHIQSMTDTLYETAMESASLEGQSKVYYKSELAEGAWFDITDALGLSDISEQGIMVLPEEMKDLKIEYYTFKDGITRDALTQKAVSIFDIKEPYDLYQLEELEAIRQQFDQQFSAEDTGVKKYYYDQLKKFFEQEVTNSLTKECDLQLEGLQTLYTSLVSSEEMELAEIVVRIMEKVDSKRRAEVLRLLSQTDNNLLNKLQEVCTGSEYDKEEYILLVEEKSTEESTQESTTEEETTEEEKTYREEREQFVENSAVLDAIASAMQSCQTSYINHIGNSLEKGTTVISNLEYEKSMEVMEIADQGAEDLILELEILFNIKDDLVVQEDSELTMIESDLLPEAEGKYESQLAAGVGEGYKVAVANGVSQAAIEQTLTQQKTELNTVLQELEFLISAQTKRQTPDDALTGIYDRLDTIEDLKARAKKDAFWEKATESVEEYRSWLTEKAEAIIEENQELASEMDKLEAYKNELTAQYQQALDENDLSLAKKTKAMMELLDEEMDLKQRELASVLEDPDSSESEKAKAMLQAGSATVLNQIQQRKQEALLMLAEGEEDLGDTLDTLAALGAEDALLEIAKAAEESGKDDIAKNADRAAKESKNSAFYGKNFGSTDGGSLEETRVEQQIEEYFGDSFEGLNQEEKAEVIGAVDFLVKDGYLSLKDLLDRYCAAYGNLDTNQLKESEKNQQEDKQEENSEEQENTGEEQEEANQEQEDTDELQEDGDNKENREQGDGTDRSDTPSQEDDTSRQQTSDSQNQAARRVPGNHGDTLLFQRLRWEEGKWAPLSVVAELLDYRYIFDDTKREVTLSRGSKAYRIKANDTKLWRYPDKTETLKERPIYQNDLYLAQEDLLTLFGCRILYLEETDMGICLTEEMYEEAEEFYRSIIEGEE